MQVISRDTRPAVEGKLLLYSSEDSFFGSTYVMTILTSLDLYVPCHPAISRYK
jgi:hypothetical protein